MASGTITIGTKGYLTARITWSSTANGSTKNNSTVSASLQIKRTNSYTTTGTWGGKLTVGSKSVTISEYKAVTNSWVTIGTVSTTIAHAASGAGSAYIYGKVTGPSGTSMSGTSISGSKTVTLDTIARAATISSAPNFTDEDNPVLKYSNPAGNSVSSLQACISLDGSTDDIAYRDIDESGTSYTFNLTDEEREVLRNACTTDKTRTVKFFVQTVIGSSTLRNNVSKTLTITNAAPTLAPTVEDVNEVTLALTGDSGTFVKGYSNASVATGATALKGAHLTSHLILNGSQSLSAASGTINAVESGSFEFRAKDSRGYLSSKTVNKTLVEYVELTCSLKANNPTADGDLAFEVRGNYFNDTFGAVANTLTIQYCYAENDGEYGAWTDATATLDGNTYSAQVALSGLDYQTKYTIKARAIDALNTKESASRSVKAMPVFDWGENDFMFNVPLYMANNNALYYLDSNGNKRQVLTLNASDNLHFGAGSYDNADGDVYYSGNNTNLRAADKLALSAANGISLVSDEAVTIPSTLHLTNTTDAAVDADNNVAFIVGPRTGQHIILDTNELFSKSSGTEYGELWLGCSKLGINSNTTKYLVWNNKRCYLCQIGTVSITPSAANTPTGKAVTFPYAFTASPAVVVSPLSTVPGTTVKGWGQSNVTTTGFTAYVTRSNTTATVLHWIACGQM